MLRTKKSHSIHFHLPRSSNFPPIAVMLFLNKVYHQFWELSLNKPLSPRLLSLCFYLPKGNNFHFSHSNGPRRRAPSLPSFPKTGAGNEILQNWHDRTPPPPPPSQFSVCLIWREGHGRREKWTEIGGKCGSVPAATGTESAKNAIKSSIICNLHGSMAFWHSFTAPPSAGKLQTIFGRAERVVGGKLREVLEK